MGVDKYRKRSTLYGVAFAHILPLLKKVAKSKGYALAVHGSMARDIDIILVPWVEDAADPEVLVDALRKAVHGALGVASNGKTITTEKPHGRLSSIIYLDKEYKVYLDLAIMPKVVKEESNG